MITAILLAAGQSKRLFNQNKLIKNYKENYLLIMLFNQLLKAKLKN